jgi:hypothetical protein
MNSTKPKKMRPGIELRRGLEGVCVVASSVSGGSCVSSTILAIPSTQVGPKPESEVGCHVASAAMESNGTASGSKRWTYFYSALQLAIQRSAHKWRSVRLLLGYDLVVLTTLFSFDDFVECFSLWAEESPDGASSVFNTIAGYQESQITVRICVYT